MKDAVAVPRRRGKRLAAREQARERILAAARKVFSERGFAAASLDRIAAEAGCTKGLVHHYFGSKRLLWESVIDRYAESARAARAPSPDGDGLDAIVARMEASFAFFRRHPDYLRFEAWAELESGARVPQSLREIARELESLVEEAQRAGTIRSDIDPRHVNAMMHNLTAGWFKTRRFFCAMWGRPARDPAVDEAYLADLLRVLRAGLAAGDGAVAGRPGRRRTRRGR